MVKMCSWNYILEILNIRNDASTNCFFCEKDRSGALCCFFSNKSESVEPDPIGFRPRSLINSTTGTIRDIHIRNLDFNDFYYFRNLNIYKNSSDKFFNKLDT